MPISVEPACQILTPGRLENNLKSIPDSADLETGNVDGSDAPFPPQRRTLWSLAASPQAEHTVPTPLTCLAAKSPCLVCPRYDAPKPWRSTRGSRLMDASSPIIAAMSQTPLAWAHPLVRDWFAARFG